MVESEKRVKAASREKSKKQGYAKQAVAGGPSSSDDDAATAAAPDGGQNKGEDNDKKANDKALAVASSSSSAAASAPAPAPAPPTAPPRRKAAAVDATFVKRMAFILRIVVPSLTSKEAMLLAIQSLMLISRSFISLRIARKGGDGLQAVMERSWKKFFMVLGDFFVSGVAASVVNSALKLSLIHI